MPKNNPNVDPRSAIADARQALADADAGVHRAELAAAEAAMSGAAFNQARDELLAARARRDERADRVAALELAVATAEREGIANRLEALRRELPARQHAAREAEAAFAALNSDYYSQLPNATRLRDEAMALHAATVAETKRLERQLAELDRSNESGVA